MGGFSEPDARDVAIVRAVARWLDTAMLDPVAGLLLPGVGDLLSSAAGLVVVGLAVRRRLPAAVVARMLLNLAVDAGVGAVPVVGDVFDVFHRAHSKNAKLFLERAEPSRSTWRDWLVVAAAGVAFLAALVLPIYVAVKVLQAIF